VGPEGQQRLLGSSVAVVGVGGLGCPLALYLAAAGVGRLTLVDPDRVDASNLHRQVLYGTADEGRLKVEVAAERLRAINPDVRVEARPVRLVAANVREVLAGHDAVADGTDNFPTRYLVNDACVLLGIPNAYGSIHRFEGQVALFDARRGPCYRCLHPEPPPPGLVPSCAEAGVLGVLPGVVGTLQATEVLKLLLGRGEGLLGRLLVYDALAMRFRELRLRKDPSCPVCGPGATIREPRDLEATCEGEAAPPSPAAGAAGAGTDPGTEGLLPEIGPEALRDRLAGGWDAVIVDVRDPWEADLGMLPGAALIPMEELPARLGEIPRDRDVVVYCHHGIRSAHAAGWLRSRGYPRVTSLAGGTDAWSARIDRSLPRY